MALTPDEEDGATRYLLGEADGTVEREVEERFFLDDAYFEDLEVLLDELINDYVSSRMSPDRRQQFERLIHSSPSLLRDVEFTSALRTAVSDSREESVPRLAPRLSSSRATMPMRRQPRLFLAAAAVLFLVAGGAWLVWGGLRLARQVVRLSQEDAAIASTARTLAAAIDQARQTSQLLQDQLQAEQLRIERLEQLLTTPAARLSAVVDFVLSPFTARPRGSNAAADSMPVLAIPPSTDLRVRLLLRSDTTAGGFLVELQTVENRVVWSELRRTVDQNSSGEPSIVVQLPALAVAKGDYVLVLKAVDTSQVVASYVFSVVRR